MSQGVNKVILVGNLGSDPEVRATAAGGRVATVSLATSKVWKNREGEKQEKTQWHRVVVWNNGTKGGLADVVEGYCKKGDKVYVEGSIEYRQWQDKDNQTRYSTEIIVDKLVLLGSPNAARQNPPAQAKTKPAENFEDFPGALEDTDDDLPF